MIATVEEAKSKTVTADAASRLLVAARRMFADKGMSGTSIRDLAQEAGVNVAAVNYHFGSKENLYLETLRSFYRECGAVTPRVQEILERAMKAGTQKAAIRGIRDFIHEFMNNLFSSEDAELQAKLMFREMSDPTPALEVIISEFVAPKMEALTTLIAQARPELRGSKDLPLYAGSVIGQCLHYRRTLPVALHFLNKKTMTPDLLEKVSAHIADFSLAGLMNAQVGVPSGRNSREAR
jgi:TetR/AcrR family transcriptional regulator, regulator of cefoperazone and chloramphenicol sensitivity